MSTRPPRALPLVAGLLLLAGCAGGVGDPRSPELVAAVRPTTAAQPIDAAVRSLAVATLDGAAAAAPSATGRRTLVIDPLIDRATGNETATTRRMAEDIAALVRERYPALELKPFGTAALEEKPLVLLGAITTVDAPGSLRNSAAPDATYRIWAVLADTASGRILSHPTAWVRPEGVDPTPTPFYRDSPVFSSDDTRAAYLRTCASDPGAPIDPTYLRSLRAQSIAADAVRAYEAGRAAQALTLYREARSLPGGDQLRVLNGVYLAERALGRRGAAEAAFAEIVDYGLTRDQLAVKLLFRPGSTAFVSNPALSGPYPMWLRQIAAGAERRSACLTVAGHASRTGTAAGNERISLARAERVRAGLLPGRPSLGPRTRAEGRGSRENLVGLGTDDLRDALDRRVEFSPTPCPTLTARAPS